jgi:hypothetical protein
MPVYKKSKKYIYSKLWIFQTNTGQSTMGIGAPVICGQNTGQHSKLEKTKIKLCFIFTV